MVTPALLPANPWLTLQWAAETSLVSLFLGLFYQCLLLLLEFYFPRLTLAAYYA